MSILCVFSIFNYQSFFNLFFLVTIEKRGSVDARVVILVTMSSATLSASSSFTSTVLSDYSQQINQLRQEVAVQRLELASLRLQFATFVKDEEAKSIRESSMVTNNNSVTNFFLRYCCCGGGGGGGVAQSAPRRRRNPARPALFLRINQPNDKGEDNYTTNNGEGGGESRGGGGGGGADSAIESPINTPTLRLSDETMNRGTTVIHSNPINAASTK